MWSTVDEANIVIGLEMLEDDVIGLTEGIAKGEAVAMEDPVPIDHLIVVALSRFPKKNIAVPLAQQKVSLNKLSSINCRPNSSTYH